MTKRVEDENKIMVWIDDNDMVMVTKIIIMTKKIIDNDNAKMHHGSLDLVIAGTNMSSLKVSSYHAPPQ